MTAELWLAICGSCGAADVFRVRPGKNVVGRTERCDIRLLYRSVSRQHAVIEYSGGEFSLRDLGSTNGTFLNGKRVQSGTVAVGDSLRFGDVELDVLDRRPNGHAVLAEVEDTPSSMARGNGEFERHASRLRGDRRQVFDLLLTGIAEKQIAAQLHMPENSVHWHKRLILSEFGVHSHTELLACVHTLAEW